MKKTIYLILGCLFFIIGTIGVILPILPSFIFYVLTLYFFTKSNEKLEDKFKNSSLYKNNVLPALDYKNGWSRLYKVKLIVSLTITMGIGFYFSRKFIIAQIIVVVIYLIHVYFFLVKVKTKKNKWSYVAKRANLDLKNLI